MSRFTLGIMMACLPWGYLHWAHPVLGPAGLAVQVTGLYLVIKEWQATRKKYRAACEKCRALFE